MSDLSARLGLPFISPAQAQKHVTHNEALIVLDALVQTGVLEFDVDAPPTGPATGDMYVVGSNPTGDWAGHPGELAFSQEGGWVFLMPQDGWRVWDIAMSRLMVFSAGSWMSLGAEFNNIEGLGIGTSFDAINPLAVDGDASLFTSSSGSHQLKINKAGDSDTASILLQSNYTGHAELGLAGDTSFALKVSADGNTWTEALKVDPGTAKIETPGINLPSGDLQAALDELQHRISGRETATVSNGEITIGTARHVEVMSSTPGTPDTLTQINGGYDGQVVTFREAGGGGNITYASDSNGGNIQTADSSDITLTQTRDSITFSLEGNKWRMIALSR